MLGVREWLESMHMEQHFDLLANAGVDTMDLVQSITDKDLYEWKGVNGVERPHGGCPHTAMVETLSVRVVMPLQPTYLYNHSKAKADPNDPF